MLLLVGGLAVSLLTLFLVQSIQDRIKTDLTHYSARHYVQLHKERTLGAIEGDLALSRHMAESEVLRA